MKYSTKYLVKMAFGIAWLICLSSCIGPAGPPGTDGLDGSAGLNGLNGNDGDDGIDGMDGNSNCVICHTDGTELLIKQQQFSISQHDSADISYQGWRAACSPCHSHDGFAETLATGYEDAVADYDYVLKMNCRTCHLIHTNYDMEDYGLVTTSAVNFRLGGVSADFGPRSNICINCHQARSSSTMPMSGGSDVEIVSKFWGLHHAPESNLMQGEGGYNFSGSLLYPVDGTNSHIDEGCVKCHMRTTLNLAGGHTFSMLSDGQENYHACVDCHSEIEALQSFNLGGVQSDVQIKMADLFTALVGKGWINPDGTINTPLTLSPDDAGALWNYRVIFEDGSDGIHNPAYIQAIVTNTLEYITP